MNTLTVALAALLSTITASAMHQAIRNGDTQAVEVFLRYDLDVNAREELWRLGPDRVKISETPLHTCVTAGKVRFIPLLLAHGACLNNTNSHGVCPLHNAATNTITLKLLLLNPQGGPQRTSEPTEQTEANTLIKHVPLTKLSAHPSRISKDALVEALVTRHLTIVRDALSRRVQNSGATPLEVYKRGEYKDEEKVILLTFERFAKIYFDTIRSKYRKLLEQ